jgi:hypothetical protein
MLQIDEVGRSGLAGRRIGRRDRLRLARRRATEGRVIRNRKIFRDRTTGGRIEVFDFGAASTSTRVRSDDAGVDREGVASYDPFLMQLATTVSNSFAQEIALAKTPVAVLRTGRMIGNVAVEPQEAKPAIGNGEGGPRRTARAIARWRRLGFCRQRARIESKGGRRSLAQIPTSSPIAHLVADIRQWRREYPDWRDARQAIEARYGYYKYPGHCHVVPNHALMILALLYAPHDFSGAQTIVCTSGWDTDCNAGNVGCLMGAMLGLEGIKAEHDWRGPGDNGRIIASKRR